MNANIQKENCLLSVTNLQKSFGKLKVLQGVDIDINKGDVVAVIGPSGCGKSTFLRCLNLLETPSAGSILLENEYVFKNERIFLKEKLKSLSKEDEAYQSVKEAYIALRTEEKKIDR